MSVQEGLLRGLKVLSSRDDLKLMHCAHDCVGAVPSQGAGSQGRVCHVNCELKLGLSVPEVNPPHRWCFWAVPFLCTSVFGSFTPEFYFSSQFCSSFSTNL